MQELSFHNLHWITFFRAHKLVTCVSVSSCADAKCICVVYLNHGERYSHHCTYVFHVPHKVKIVPSLSSHSDDNAYVKIVLALCTAVNSSISTVSYFLIIFN